MINLNMYIAKISLPSVHKIRMYLPFRVSLIVHINAQNEGEVCDITLA